MPNKIEDEKASSSKVSTNEPKPTSTSVVRFCSLFMFFIGFKEKEKREHYLSFGSWIILSRVRKRPKQIPKFKKPRHL